MDFMTIFHSVWTVTVTVMFVGIVLWAYSRGSQQRFDEAARLPFNDEDEIEVMNKENQRVH